MQQEFKKTILLVEDIAIIAMAEANTLKHNGFDVIIAFNGTEAVKLASENSNIDLILMDIDLGKGMNGTEAAQIILKNRDIPIVFLSNHTEKEIVEKTEKITSYGYVVKNSGETVLLASIKMAFKLFEAHHQMLESEMKLIESDRKFRTLEKQIDDVIWTMDMNFRFTYVSPSVEKMHGYTVDEMMKLNPQDYLTEESSQKIINILSEEISSYLKNKIEENIVTIELEQIKKDGTVFLTEIKARFLLDKEKNPMSIIGVTRDITQRLLSEKALRDSEKTLNLALEGAQIALWDQNFKTGVVNRSDYWAIMLGYDPEEIKNNLEFWKSHIHPEDYELVMNEAKKHEAGLTEYFKVQHRMRCKNGSYKWILNWGKISERDEDGNPVRGLGIHLDIDANLKTEEALRESEYKFRTLFEIMTTGVVYHDSDGKIISANPAAQEILGLTMDQMQGKTSMDPQWKCIREDGTDFPGEEHPVMISLKTGKVVEDIIMGVFHPKKNSYIWININAIPKFKTESDKLFRVYVTFEDITLRKLTEENLKQSEENYRRFFDEDLSGVFLSTPESGLKKCNQAYVNMMEYESIDDLISSNPVSHYSKSQQRIDFLNLIRKEKKLTNYEGEIVTKSGKHIQTLENIIGVFDDEDNLIEFWGYINDITDRKKAEQALKDAAMEKEALHRELLHRVKNSFNLIKSLMYLEREKLDNKEANKILENLEMRIGTLSKMYSLLNMSGISQHINLGEYLNQITKSLTESYIEDSKSIEIKSSYENIEMSPRDASSVGLIVNEILTNSLKYAFPDNKLGSIFISLKTRNGNVEIQISDNGIGVSDSFSLDDAKGMGLQLINMLTRQLSGTVTVEANNGTRFKIVFPLEQ